MGIDNLARPTADLEKLIARIERLERAAPVGFTAVSRGALRIVSAEGLIVEGSARISGVLTGDGQLTWSGGITFTGPFSINGVTTQNGAYTVNGAWKMVGPGTITGNVGMTGKFDLTGDATMAGAVDITGELTVTGPAEVTGTLKVTGASEFLNTLKIKGVTTLENDLKVINAGKIKLGDGLTLEPSPAGGGAINFNPTGSIAAGLGKITMVAPDLSVLVSIGGDALDVAGGTLRASLTQDTDSGHLANVYFNTSTRTFHYKA